MNTLTDAWEPTINDLRYYYNRYFSLNCLATTSTNKFVLISLICFLTLRARVKNPKATCEQVIRKITGEMNSKNLVTALSVICEDYMLNSEEFPTFKLKTATEMVEKIKEILHTELPFKATVGEEILPF